MATPFQVQGTLTLPGTPGSPAVPVPFGLAQQFDSKVEFELVLSSTPGTQVVDFGTMPTDGVKCLLCTYDHHGGTDDIKLVLNGANKSIPVSPGGCLLFCSPVPDTGITSLSVQYTNSGRVHVWLLG